MKIETQAPLEADAAVVVTMKHFEPLHGTVRGFRDGTCEIACNQLVPFEKLIARLEPSRWSGGLNVGAASAKSRGSTGCRSSTAAN